MRPIKREKNAQLKLSYGDGFVVHSLYLISRKSSLPTSVNLLDIIFIRVRMDVLVLLRLLG